MLEELKQAQKVVGSKQARRALRDGRAKKIYIARDADPAASGPGGRPRGRAGGAGGEHEAAGRGLRHRRGSRHCRRGISPKLFCF